MDLPETRQVMGMLNFDGNTRIVAGIPVIGHPFSDDRKRDLEAARVEAAYPEWTKGCDA